jgi:uncharacterized membrane protein
MAEGKDEGIPENAAGVLCYVLGWITGLIFFLTDKRPFVRFHAAQSMVVFGGLSVIYYILARITNWGFVLDAIGLLMTVLWIVLMVKAYQGERFKVPVAAEIAENIAGRSEQKP